MAKRPRPLRLFSPRLTPKAKTGEGRKSAEKSGSGPGTGDAPPPGCRPPSSSAKLQTRDGGSGGAGEGPRGGEALAASAASALRGADGDLQGGNVRRRRRRGREALGGAARPQGCPAGLAGAKETRPRPSSPGREAAGARGGAGGSRREALGCGGAGAPGWRAREAGAGAARGWRREQAERKPGQGQRGKRQGADEIQEEEEVDEDEAGPPAGSGGGGGGGREKRLAGSWEDWAVKRKREKGWLCRRGAGRAAELTLVARPRPQAPAPRFGGWLQRGSGREALAFMRNHSPRGAAAPFSCVPASTCTCSTSCRRSSSSCSSVLCGPAGGPREERVEN